MKSLAESKKIFSSSFFGDMATILSGNIVNQLILICLFPIIARIYDPYEIGIFEQFNSYLIVFIIIATLRYESAIIIAPNNQKKITLFVICVAITSLISVIMFFVLLFFKDWIVEILGAEALGNRIFLLPLFLLIIGIQTSLYNTVIKHKRFKQANIANMFKSGLNNILKFFFGLGGFLRNGFFLARGLSFLGSLTYLVITQKKTIIEIKDNWGYIKNNFFDVLKEYKDFPLLMNWGVVFNSVSISLIAIIISKYYGVDILAYYSMANTILNIPITMIKTSLQTVFFQRISERNIKKEPLYLFFKKTTLYLMLISIIPFIIVILFGEEIFSFVLGINWLMSGQFASIIAPWLFFTLITAPASAMIPVINLQKFFILIQLINLLLRVGLLFVSAIAVLDAVILVYFLSITGIVTNIISLIYITRKVKKNDRINYE